MPSSPLLTAERRASRYWFDDGLPTILVGTAYLLMAFFLLYPREGSSTFAAIVSFAAVLGYGMLILRQRQILDWLKSRIIYPRTGYVAPPPCADDPQSCSGVTALSLNEAASTDKAADELAAERPRSITGADRVAWFLVGAGALFFLDGVWALFRYLRANPRPAATNR
jgi:hypothetical protein